MSDFWVNGIVAQRNEEPYIQLSTEKGIIAQLSMAEARQVAQDILVTASRCEMDAMLLKFFKKAGFPEQVYGTMMQGFRDFRAEYDQERIYHKMTDPDTGEDIK